MAISLQEFVNLVNNHKNDSIETLKSTLKAVRGLEDMERQSKEIRHYLNKVFKAPKNLNTLEKIIYYFNRKQNVTLQEIADIGGYEIGYILNVSMRINKKLKKSKDKNSK